MIGHHEFTFLLQYEFDTDDCGHPVILHIEPVAPAFERLPVYVQRELTDAAQKLLDAEREARRSEPQGETVPYFRSV